MCPSRCSLLVLSRLWDLLFFHFDTLPATVPVAIALLLLEGFARWHSRRAPWRLHGELILAPERAGAA